MDVEPTTLAEILTRYQAREISETQATAELVALGADPYDATEMLEIADGGDDVVETAES